MASAMPDPATISAVPTPAAEGAASGAPSGAASGAMTPVDGAPVDPSVLGLEGAGAAEMDAVPAGATAAVQQ